MSEADDYQEAKARIAKAKADGAQELDFRGLSDLTQLPPEIADIDLTSLDLNGTQISDISVLEGMTGMTTLDLGGTRISDISALKGMAGMTSLFLGNTQISDIAVLRGMTGMTALYLDGTGVTDISALQEMTEITTLYLSDAQISDLRVLLNLTKLESPSNPGHWVSFTGIPALSLDPTLAEIAEITDIKERASKLFARLREVKDEWPLIPDAGPEQIGTPRVKLMGDRVELLHSHPNADEIADPVKQKTLERLRDAVDRMVRVGNRYPDIDDIARGLARRIEPDLSEIDLFEVHLDLEITRGIYERRNERQGEDVLEPEAVSALERVTMIGPGLTLDNEQVERLEERRARYSDSKPGKPDRDAQDALSQSVAGNERVFGDDLRALEDRLAQLDQKTDRLLSVQSDGNRNVIQVVGMTVATGVFWGVAGGPLSSVGTSGMEWLVANSDTILILAPQWGEAFKAWITPIIMRSREASASLPRRK